MLLDYDNLGKTLDRLRVLDPSDVDVRLARAGIERDQRADLRPWRAKIEKITAEDPANAERIKRARFYLAMLERDFDAAGRIAAELPQKRSFDDGYELGRLFWVGLVARLKGDTAAAQAAFTTARHEQEEIVRAQPEDGQSLLGLAVIDSELGRKEQALQEGKESAGTCAGHLSASGRNYFFCLDVRKNWRA